jgi:cytochrome c-type biogenesis protein CcmH
MQPTLRVLLVLWACCCATAFAQAASTAAELERRELAIAAELRCLVCQNQSIAESNADLARDLRQQIREQLAAGKSDAEIRDFMTARYGDFVLYRPPLKGGTLLLWFGPFLLLALGALVIARIVRGRRASVTLSDEERARATALLGRRPGDGA